MYRVSPGFIVSFLPGTGSSSSTWLIEVREATSPSRLIKVASSHFSETVWTFVLNHKLRIELRRNITVFLKKSRETGTGRQRAKFTQRVH